MRESYPHIQTVVEGEKQQESFYLIGVEKIIQHLLPPNFFVGENIPYKLEKQLPIICWSAIREPPFDISFFLCCHLRPDAFRFFYDMITRWLVPGKNLKVSLQFATDFTIPEIGPQEYIAGQVRVKIESISDLEKLQKNLPIIEKEIRLGVNSSYQASRILEIKGLSSDKKTALIQENLVLLIKRRPQHFDYDILSEMQHFLVLCKDEFKAEREYRHLSRIIAVNYLFQKSLTLSGEAYLDKRLVNIKLMRQKVGKKIVLGIVVGISFLLENERLEARHLVLAIRKLVKNTLLVKGSFFFRRMHSDKACTFYIEVEKKEGVFLKKEMELLQTSLTDEIKGHIEQSVNPIFMPDNEEVILRNILTLKDQLKFVRDLPQAIITFKQQVGNKLEFLVVLVRLWKTSSIPIARLFELGESKLDVFFERNKHVGHIRKKHIKEANVFYIQIPKAPYLRQDHSIDLYKAREFVTRELRHILGEFRDYNGGYMSKERELFLSLSQQLGIKAQKNAFLLENFFYSITPISVRGTLEVQVLKTLFEMLLFSKNDLLREEQQYSFHSQEVGEHYFILVVGVAPGFKKPLLQSIHELKIDKDRMAHFSLQDGDQWGFGLLLQRTHKEEAVRLRSAAARSLEEWSEKRINA